jgi:hypothetical protein
MVLKYNGDLRAIIVLRTKGRWRHKQAGSDSNVFSYRINFPDSSKDDVEDNEDDDVRIPLDEEGNFVFDTTNLDDP